MVDVRRTIVRGVHASPLATAVAGNGLVTTGHEVTNTTFAVEPEGVEGVVVASPDISKGMPGELSDLLGGVDTTAPSETQTDTVPV